MMAATLAIWRQPVAERRAVGSLGLTWFLLVLVLLGSATLALDTPKARLLSAFFTGVPMGMLLFMWWIYLCANVRAQCHPAALQLVPGLREQMVRAVVLAWLAIVATMTLLAGVPSGYPVQVALVTALVLVETSFAGTGRYLALGIVLMVLPQVGPGVVAWLGPFLATPAGLLAGAVLVAVDGAAALRRVPRLHGKVVATPAGPQPLQERLRWARGRPAGWLDRAADPQPAFLQPLGRSWFGPHWTTLAGSAVVCAVVLAWAASRPAAAAATWLTVHCTMIALGLPGLLALCVYREAQRFATARTEQALLMLTPGAPDQPEVNGLLAGLLVRGFVRSWLIHWILSCVVLTALGVPAASVGRLCAVWLAALVLASVPMRDFARHGGAPGGAAAVVLAVLLAVLGVASALAVNGKGSPTAWMAYGATGVVVGVAAVAWRWRAMHAAAPALPAGRYAPASDRTGAI